MISVMNFQYLFCASCGTRRTGHGYQCSVCGNLLRHETPRVTHAPSALRTTVQWQAPVPARTPEPERQPVAA
jgi:tRNA(Ile2) C34 agmatinyltransferase TiaS